VVRHRVEVQTDRVAEDSIGRCDSGLSPVTIAEVTSMPFSIHIIHLARTEMLVAEANNISVSNAPCLSFVCKFRELLRNVPQNGW